VLWQHDDKKELTIDALAKRSGFSNRVSFINAFKKKRIRHQFVPEKVIYSSNIETICETILVKIH